MSFIRKDVDKYDPRPEQTKIVDHMFQVLEKKKDNKFFLLNVPTGIGKSHLAMMVADRYLDKINRDCKVDVITAGKLLQDQYSDTYETIRNLKGKENYHCSKYACSCAQGMEFNRLNKSECDSCPYDSARQGFITGKLSLTNFYLYLIYAVFNPTLLRSRESRLLIVDESHSLDEVMSDFISIRVSEGTIKRLKFTREKDVIRAFGGVRDIDGFILFLEYLEGQIGETVAHLEGDLSDGRNEKADKRALKIAHINGTPNEDLKVVQVISDLKQYGSKIKIFLDEYKVRPENWVMESSYSEKLKYKELTLEPIWSADYLDRYVWSHYDHVVLMSGTLLSKSIFTRLAGIDVARSVYYSIPSPFPVENRPIYYMPLGKMSWAKKEETFNKYVPMISRILNKYKDKKGIIHTNSFELSNWIQQRVQNSRLIFHDSEGQADALRRHFESKEDTVIVSPSLHTGVSFDDSKARFQIVAKMPYPSLGSQKNKLRQKVDPEWYAWRTCVSLIQTLGRINRSSTDYGETVILDESFSDILRHSSEFIPDWIQAAIKRVPVK
jgi:Rad3-related DNA helicase